MNQLKRYEKRHVPKDPEDRVAKGAQRRSKFFACSSSIEGLRN